MSRRSKFSAIIVITASVLMAGSVPTKAQAPLELKLSASTGFEPLTVYVKVYIDTPHYQNEWLCLTWEQDLQFWKQSCQMIPGQYTARIHDYTLKSLAAGDYTVYATLIRTRGSFNTPVQTIRVLERQY